MTEGEPLPTSVRYGCRSHEFCCATIPLETGWRIRGSRCAYEVPVVAALPAGVGDHVLFDDRAATEAIVLVDRGPRHVEEEVTNHVREAGLGLRPGGALALVQPNLTHDVACPQPKAFVRCQRAMHREAEQRLRAD